MSENIRKRGKYHYYDMMIDGVRYKGTTKTDDKKLAENIADTIKADILRKKHSLASLINYRFQDIWEQYLKAQTVRSYLTQKRKIIASKNFLPLFTNKNNIDTRGLTFKLLNQKH